MQVDYILRWVFYLELFTLFIVFIPLFDSFKRGLLLSVSPLFSKIQLVFWIFWSFIGFIFVTTVKDAYFTNTPTSSTLDATAKLELARNERDAMMSFITLLLLPIIHLHSKSVLKIYRLQQSVTAMTKQATNASNQYKLLLEQQETVTKGKMDKKSKQKTKDKDNDDVDTKMLRDELSLCKARLEKSNKRCQALSSELDSAKQQLAQFDTLQKVVKKKA